MAHARAATSPESPKAPVRPLVILPTYQEAENIAEVLGRIHAALPAADVLVVDDGSPDGTADLAEQAGAEAGKVEIMRRPAKLGLGSAYRAGFAWGIERGYDAMIGMDADLSHDPSVLPTLLTTLGDGIDLCIGSRYVKGGVTPAWQWYRLLLSRWGNRYASAALGLGVNDSTAGFRAYRADLLSRLDLASVRAEGYGFQIEMTYQTRMADGAIREIPIIFADRTRGTSKMSGPIIVEALLLVTWWGLRDRILRRRPP